MINMALLRKVHKWLALVVGLQLLIWVATGLLFTLVDGAKSHGQIYRVKHTIEQAPALPERILTNIQLAEKLPASVVQQKLESIELKVFHQHWYYQVSTHKTRYLFSATSGEQLIVQEPLAVELINQSYHGPGKLSQLLLLTPAISEFSHAQGNIWQAHFSDELNTQVYLAQNTGRIIKHANDVSAYNDILKMLHFMDYDQSGHFNSWWIITMAILASLLSFTGLFWLINIYSKKFKKRFLNVA